MGIVLIDESHWDQIFNIQKEAYSDIEPESVSVLKSKWSYGRETCFVYLADGVVVGYLLAHPWDDETPPSLSKNISVKVGTDQLYLHDLAISSKGRGKGIGKLMVNALLNRARSLGVAQIGLVAVQGAERFWSQFGFVERKGSLLCSSYGTDAVYMHAKVVILTNC